MRKSTLDFEQIKELPSKRNKMSPLLMAVEANLFSAAQFMITELSCDIEAVCGKQNNVLHYAVMNKNLEIILKLVIADSESSRLRK